MGDMLYNFTEWLRSTQLTELSLWIADTGLSNLIVTNFWAIPIIQVFHILSLAAAFGAVFPSPRRSQPQSRARSA